jgi:hypothetical protein
VTKQIFDQERPRSTMAQRLEEAFAGCDEWTVVAAPPRRSALDSRPRATSVATIFDGAELFGTEESRAA